MKKTILLCLTVLLSTLSWVGVAQTGNTCGNPLVVFSTPFSSSGDLNSYGDDYTSSDRPAIATGAVTNGTGSSSYLNGFEVVYSYTAGSNGSIDISTTNDDDWVALWVFSGCPFSSTEGYHTQTSGTTRSIPGLPVVAGQTYYIVISNWYTPASTNYTLSITGTQVLNPPTCLPPSNLIASNPTPNSVDLGWTETGTATTWDIEWGLKGFIPTGTPTILGTTTNPHPLSGLTPQTEYDFYVRADCGAGDLSSWTGPYTFETTCSSQLAGTYTIGATGDYTTLGAAVTALNTCGISGSVVFNILTGSGPYNEQLVINEFLGSNATNTVTFNGNGETLTASTTTGSRSLFLLDGADYVTINNFNLVTIEDTNNFVIQLTNDANFNTISNNTIDLTSTLSSSSTSNAGIVSSGSLTSATTAGNNSSNLTINNNTVIGGYYGIIINGTSSSSLSMNNTITENTVQDFYSYGIYMKSTGSGSVNENDIHRTNRISTSTMYGIYYTTGGENNITSGNRIHDSSTSESSSSTAYGIYHSSNDASPGNENLVFNNIIYNFNSDSSTVYALYNSGSDYVNYYFNTVSLDNQTSTGGTTRGFYQTGSATGIEFKNNIISITRGGSGVKYALYFGTAGSTINSDNNDLYVNAVAGTNGIGYLGSGQTTLADWQNATGGDMNSIDLDPMFTSPFSGDLIPTSPAVNNLGTPIASVTTDIDGNPRSATTPDMGAYEFSPPSCFQPTNLAITGATATTADFTWDHAYIIPGSGYEYVVMTPGAQPAVATAVSTGTAPSNSATATGLSALTQYDLYVRSNCGAGDLSDWEGPLNFYSGCAAPYAGTYTIGGASADFATISDAVLGLNTCGISGPVVFNVTVGSGPFSEHLTIEEVVGASATNTITFNGNGETLSAVALSSSSALFLLDGADYVTIDNFNLVTVEETDNFVIQLTNDANYNTISNNTIDLSSTFASSSSSNAGIVMSGSLSSATTTGINGSNLTITNNTIIGGYYGVILLGDSSSDSMNNNISGNTIQDFYSYGVYLRYTSNGSVDGNEIHRMNRALTTTFNGIYYSSGGQNNVTNANVIHDSSTSESSSSTAYAIYHSSIDAAPGSENIVSNNVIYNFNSDSSTIYAFYNSGSDGVHYYYNTVSLDNPAASSGTTRGFYQTTSASGIELKNNIISITRGGSGTKYALYFATAASTIVSDYNDLYVNAPAGTNGIGYLGSGQTTLLDWQTASGGDANSVDLDPMFAAPLFGNLNPTNVATDNLGIPIAGITTDINGSPRSATTPDMGAYEFTPPTCLQPSLLTASNITDTSANLMWQPNGVGTEWEIEYGLTGFAPGSGTLILDNDGTVGEQLIGLSPQTTYDFYVRAICSPTDSSLWTGPKSFSTLCSPTAAPFFDDVEAHTPTVNITASMCWTADSDSSFNWNISNADTPSSFTGPAAAYSGTNFFYTEASNGATGDEARLHTQSIDISEMTGVELSFYYHMYGSAMGTLNVDVFDGTSWTNSVASITGEQQTSHTDPWLKKTVSLASYTGVIQIRFRAVSAGTYEGDISIDDIKIDGTPLPCPDPSAIVVSAITDTSAAISWTENGTATEWEIEYGATGYTQGTGTVISDTDGTLGETLSGLSSNSSYDVYVRAICSATRTSAWIGPLTFTTACADPSAIVVSNITDSQANVSWTENGTATEWEIEYGLAGFTQGTAGGTIVSDNDGTLGETLGGLNDNTSYDVYVRAICSATNMSTWIGPVSFTTLTCADPSAIVFSNITDSQADVSWTENGTATEWEIEYGLAGFTQGSAGGTIVSDNDGTLGETLGGLDDNTAYDVYVRAICSGTNTSAWVGPVSFTTLVTPCIDPSAIVVSNITDSTADVSWTENGTATEWEIEYGLAGFTPGSAGGTIVSDNDGTLGETLSGLDDNTAYDVYVRAICSGTNTSAWVGPVSFTTLVTPCAAPSAIVVSNITDSTADVSWTENGTATEWEIEYGLAGFTPGSAGGTIVSDNDGTLGETLSGLDDDTVYDVYVRAICTSTNMSAWVGPESFTTDTTVKVGENEFIGFAYYPNPMMDVINITSQNQKYELTIFNVIGQQLLTHKMEANTATLDVSHFASGQYLMQVVSESGKTAFYKLIKN